MRERHHDPGFRRLENHATDCQRASEHLHAFVEDELDPIRSSSVREHLASCAGCRQSAEDLKAERIWFVEAAVRSPALSDSFTAKVSKRIEQAVHARAQRRRRSLVRAGGSAAAAATLIAALLFFSSPRSDVPSPGIVKEVRAPALEVARVEKALPPPAIVALVPERAAEKPRSRASEVITESAAAFVQPASFRRPEVDSNFGNVIGMAVRLSPSSPAALYSPGRDDPCRPDPNKDGKTDLIDVAYSCQVILVGQPPSPFDASDSKPAEISDCDEACLRV